MSVLARFDRTGSGAHTGGAAPRQKVAFIGARWHADIVAECRDAFQFEMRQSGVSNDRLFFFEVPGAFEIPLVANRLARSGQYAAIVASAFVVNGGIYRHDFVASTVIDALMRVQLDTDVSVISAVLTPHHFHEHDEHRAFFKQHFRVKGAEAAAACLQVVDLQAQLATAEY